MIRRPPMSTRTDTPFPYTTLFRSRIIGANDAAVALGAEGPISAIGYVFDENWAARNLATVRGFVAASRDAKELLRTSDAEWEALREMTGAEDDATLAALRDGDRKSTRLNSSH